MPAVLLHVPLPTASVNVVVPPLAHMAVVPFIAEAPLTVKTALASLPHPVVYPIVTVPGATPVTVPDALPIEAMDGVKLYQLPPDAASVNVVVPPTQRDRVPFIGNGNGVTVTVTVYTVAGLQPGLPLLLTVNE